jgi:hypothetical protein
MDNVIDKYLNKLELAIDLEHQSKVKDTCLKVLNFKEVEELPFVYGEGAYGSVDIPDRDWPSFPYNDSFADMEKMLLNELRAVFIRNQLKDYSPLNIRANYGTVIMPSIFGAGYTLTETSMPWSYHLENRDKIKTVIDKGVPSLETGLGKQCFDTARYYMETLDDFPKLSRAINIFHPDLQGPFDIAHLIWGSDIFLALYDCPELVHELLRLVTVTYKAYMKKWIDFTGIDPLFTTQWNFYTKGGIMLRDDTAVMLSPQQCDEFVLPYDKELLDEFGGCMHFCGNGKPFIENLCRGNKKLFGVNSSQTHLNDMNRFIHLTLPNKIAILGLPKEYLSPDMRTGVILLKS